MCQPSWRSALLAAQRQDDLVWLRRAHDPTGGERPPPLDVQPLTALRPSPESTAPPYGVRDHPCCGPVAVLVRTAELR